MTRQGLSVWQSEDKQLASLKALSKSVCMPFRALAWPKCQSNIWQNHITLFHSPSLSLPLWILFFSFPLWCCSNKRVKSLRHSSRCLFIFDGPEAPRRLVKWELNGGAPGKKVLTFYCMLLSLAVEGLKTPQAPFILVKYFTVNNLWWLNWHNALVLFLDCCITRPSFCVTSHRDIKQHYPQPCVACALQRNGILKLRVLDRRDRFLGDSLSESGAKVNCVMFRACAPYACVFVCVYIYMCVCVCLSLSIALDV